MLVHIGVASMRCRALQQKLTAFNGLDKTIKPVHIIKCRNNLPKILNLQIIDSMPGWFIQEWGLLG